MLSKEETEKAKKVANSYIKAIDTFGTIDYKCINNLYTPTKTLLQYIEQLEQYLERISKQLDNIAIDQIPIGIKELQQENKTLTHTNKSYKGIINKQNKIIDEMANHKDICTKVEKPFCNNETSVPVNYCIECIKQYFEKKVEEK